jgi:hypothetical protein
MLELDSKRGTKLQLRSSISRFFCALCVSARGTTDIYAKPSPHYLRTPFLDIGVPVLFMSYMPRTRDVINRPVCGLDRQ